MHKGVQPVTMSASERLHRLPLIACGRLRLLLLRRRSFSTDAVEMPKSSDLHLRLESLTLEERQLRRNCTESCQQDSAFVWGADAHVFAAH
eukprot:2085791-Amphidinium_carterae.1